MSVLDVYCRNCFSSAWCNPLTVLPDCPLYVGTFGHMSHFSCLYFYLPPNSTLGSLQQARLILFKRPASSKFLKCSTHSINSPYLLCPLKEYYTSYSYTQTPIPNYDNSVCVYPDSNTASVEIDITTLVQGWLTGTIENKGLLLMGYKNSQPSIYGSLYSDTSLIPFIRLNFMPLVPPSNLCVDVGTSLDLTYYSTISLSRW